MWLVGIGVLYVFLLGYSVMIIQQLLFVVWITVLLGVLYLSWRFVAAVEAIADAVQQIAHQRNQN